MSTRELNWKAVDKPVAITLTGRYVRLEKLDPVRHSDDLWAALHGEASDPLFWDYLPYGPFEDRELFDIWLDGYAISDDPLGFCVVDLATDTAEGILSLMSIFPAHGRLEIGHVAFGRPMQRSPKGTEAVYLLAKLAFDLGYRRVEWKCDYANQRSRRAAERYGFTPEGVFHQHMVVKGRNRDTAFFAIMDEQWPMIESGFDIWLAEANQTPDGQIKSLIECRQPTLVVS